MKKVIVFIILAIISSYAAYSKSGSIFKKLKGQKYPIAYYDGNGHTLGNFPLKKKKPNNPTNFKIKNGDAGLELSIEYSNLGKSLNLTHLLGDRNNDFISQQGELCESCFLEVALYDFDKDGFGEIIVAISDGVIDMAVYVFKYTPSNNLDEQGTLNEWKFIGYFSGQNLIYLEKNSIVLPYGSQGLYNEYKWNNGKFEEVDLIVD